MKTPKIDRERRALRPRQIKERFGIAPSTLHYFLNELPEAERLPSIQLPSRGRKRRLGIRLVYEDELIAWLERHRQKGAKVA